MNQPQGPHREQVPDCSIKHLGNPNLAGLIPGITVDLELNQEFFQCCNGQSMRWNEKVKAAEFCLLKARFNAVRTLGGQYFQTWPHQSELPWQRKNDSFFETLAQTSKVLKGQSPQATILKGSKSKAGQPWTVAFALSWRFGANVHLATLTKHRLKDAIPNEAFLNKKQPRVIIVEQVDSLRDEAKRHALETLVGLAYQCQCYLWVEIVTPQKPRPSQNFSHQKIHNYVANLRHKESENLFEQFLDPSCYSKLDSLRHSHLRSP